MTLPYDRLNRNAFALAAGTGALRKAAEAAGLPFYVVPFCGAGFAGHSRSTRTGKCLTCPQIRKDIAFEKYRAAKQEKQEKKVLEAAAKRAQVKHAQPRTSPWRLTEAQAVVDGALRAQALAAGAAQYQVPYCGGGFTDHFRATASRRCITCKTVRTERRKLAALAALDSINSTPSTQSIESNPS